MAAGLLHGDLFIWCLKLIEKFITNSFGTQSLTWHKTYKIPLTSGANGSSSFCRCDDTLTCRVYWYGLPKLSQQLFWHFFFSFINSFGEKNVFILSWPVLSTRKFSLFIIHSEAQGCYSQITTGALHLDSFPIIIHVIKLWKMMCVLCAF